MPFHDRLNSLIGRFATSPDEGVAKQITQRFGISPKKPIRYFLFRCLREIVTYPDLNKGWKSPAIKVGKELLEKEGISTIISTSPPIMSNLIAKGLKERYKIERKFGEAKQSHGFGRCRYIGKARFAIQSFLTAIVLNLKRMVKLLTGVNFKDRAYAAE